MAEEGERAAFSVRTAELIVAAAFFLLGAIVIYGSVRLGAKWDANGPQPGYFPFYVGLIICISSMINFARGLRIRGERNTSFVSTGALRQVLSVLVPTAVFAALVGWLGIYVSGTLFIGLFMRWLGKYAWWKVALIAVGTSVAFFFIFEVWFLVPLPKGPLEALLHLD
ncbi:MAG TPA: tripartite tricarboxylate transporter TctB family protein [Burkholderiales bacterium]|nr:tripartite tricarboxylate transporter TctB family protein [Burkholderiales bacterium]